MIRFLMCLVLVLCALMITRNEVSAQGSYGSHAYTYAVVPAYTQVYAVPVYAGASYGSHSYAIMPWREARLARRQARLAARRAPVAAYGYGSYGSTSYHSESKSESSVDIGPVIE